MILWPVYDLDSHSLLGTLFFFVLDLLSPIIWKNIFEEMPNFRRFISIFDHPQLPSVLA